MSTPSKKVAEVQQFSPAKSPGTRSDGAHQGNLTGSLRKVKDGVADIHNLVIKWNKHHMDGLVIIKEIANIKLESVFNRDSEDAENPVPSMPSSLEPLCEKLLNIYQSLEKVVKKLDRVRSVLIGVQKLNDHLTQDDKSDVLFHTWTIEDFVANSNQLVAMYTKELDLKKQLCENVAHADDRTTTMFYTSAWLHQPYIDENATAILDMMLLESGHKK
ncbi:cyclin-dependent kinase 2-interacting protein-like [Gigantopelta aegis]|uniref:cyclin-dependent kinase 2-interacting protein-like n=1 Tax=Gigantopelta aegis TaxID=1735272 RepID=UPI001B88A2D4|nr:cyclin-dependent kinase 2-interacting protein-like [Gigantopelta aegis]